jgi:hypothetical protein
MKETSKAPNGKKGRRTPKADGAPRFLAGYRRRARKWLYRNWWDVYQSQIHELEAAETREAVRCEEYAARLATDLANLPETPLGVFPHYPEYLQDRMEDRKVQAGHHRHASYLLRMDWAAGWLTLQARAPAFLWRWAADELRKLWAKPRPLAPWGWRKDVADPVYLVDETDDLNGCRRDSCYITILGGDNRNLIWEEYVAEYTAQVATYFRLIRLYLEAHDLIGGVYGSDMDEMVFGFADGWRMGFTWRAWGDLMQAIVGKREGYMRYYMRDF